jgi:hypothetical protein
MTRKPTRAQLETALVEQGARLTEHVDTIELLSERFAELELALEDSNWIRLSANAEKEFSREGLKRITTLARLSFLKNPLINHAVMVQCHYVWGQGVNINAVDQDVNSVVQEFLDDPANKKELTGHMARIEKEIEINTAGNVFIVLFTDTSTGKVKLRSIEVSEIEDIITDPEDTKTPWYYYRIWSQRVINADGKPETKQFKAYYPDWQYNPTAKPAAIGNVSIKWESPVYHVKVGGFSHMRFGVPTVYSALDWAKAVKEDMEDYATIRRALSRFAWRLSTAGGKTGVQNAKTKLATSLRTDTAENNPPPTAGSTFIQSQGGAMLEPIKTAGTTTHPDEGRRMWLLVSAGTGIPETILSGDAQVGNYATSRTLDRPTELQMRTRQTMWADVMVDILAYVIAKSKRAANGGLANFSVRIEEADRPPQKGSHKSASNGHVSRKAFIDLKLAEAANVRTGELVSLARADGEKGGAIELHVDFPPILEHDPLPRVQAIVQAATLNGQVPVGTMTDKTLVRLLLVALGEDNVDELLMELFPDGGTDLPIGEGDREPDQTGEQLPMGGRSGRARQRQPVPTGAE